MMFGRFSKQVEVEVSGACIVRFIDAEELLEDFTLEIISRYDETFISITYGYVRAYVKISLFNHLPSLVYKFNEKGNLVYGRIVYEKLKVFCFHCGLVSIMSVNALATIVIPQFGPNNRSNLNVII